jgi:acyl-CoA synthetase (NDP forming)
MLACGSPRIRYGARAHGLSHRRSPVNLQPLLEPRSVAIVGASVEPKKLSGMIMAFLRASGYAGRIYPVNPRYDRIDTLPCYASVDAVPETVDLLVCAVPVAAAFAAVEAAAHRGVPFCLLMSGGFGEGRSGAAGDARRERLLRLCAETGLHVVGPNTVGMVNFRARLPLTFADWYARDTGQRGGVAIVTHSGSVGGLIFSSLQLHGIGVDYWLGLGNEATLETADFIAHFNDDPCVHTIVCYLEGVRDGRRFFEAAAAARRRGKRIVALRAGRHPESARSTASHTGKRPTDAGVYAGIFRQLGIVDVGSLAELSAAMRLLDTAGSRLGPRIGILSASGGACSLLADHVIEAGLALPQLPPPLQDALNRSIPEYGSSLNPVDLSADVVSRAEILHGALAVLHADAAVDVWLVFGRPIVDRYAAALVEFARTSGKTVLVSCGVPLAPEIAQALRAGGIGVLEDPALCLRALACIVRAQSAPAAPAATQAAVAANVRLTVEEDRDFGPIVALASAQGSARAVRALPASRADLADALAELAACDSTPSTVDEGGLDRLCERIRLLAGSDAIAEHLAARP